MERYSILMNQFYIYGLVDPRDQKIKYIGKGSGDRMFRHIKYVKRNCKKDHNYTKFDCLKEILESGFEDIAYRKLFETDNELEAYTKETEYIKQYNTHISKNGWNITWGGEGQCGHKHSEESKKKMSIAKKNISDETRKKMSESGKKKKFSDEHKQKISMSLIGNSNSLGYKFSEDSRKKMSEARMGRVGGMLGKKHSEETKQKMKNARKKFLMKHTHTEENNERNF